MTYAEEDYLQLSGIQHFTFCRRQWALIHVEQAWQENSLTAEGKLMHERAHDETFSELRGDALTIRGMRVASAALGISGACDVTEFIRDDQNGTPLIGYEGRWRAYPVEYKRGKPKEHQADELQLCAQAMCLMEMLACDIPSGALYYGQTRRRVEVMFTDALQNAVRQTLTEMHAYAARGYTPRVKAGQACKSCSLTDVCVPKLPAQSAEAYIRGRLAELERDEQPRGGNGDL